MRLAVEVVAQQVAHGFDQNPAQQYLVGAREKWTPLANRSGLDAAVSRARTEQTALAIGA
jgi:hypothetical protein